VLPVFIGLLVWAVICVSTLSGIFLFVPSLRRFVGFVFLTPTIGGLCALVGFIAIGWLLDGRMRAQVATSIAFYLGFLLCGGVGSILGLGAGFVVWRRASIPKQAP
jgi:hypothetical protein